MESVRIANCQFLKKDLKLYPDATRCLACQEAFEEGKTVRRISFYFDFLKSAIFLYLNYVIISEKPFESNKNSPM